MFRAEIFNTVLSPIFSDGFNYNCNVEVLSNKEGKKRRDRVDNINILTMPYSESVIALALTKVSTYKETRQIKLKENLLKEIERKTKPGKGKKKEPLTEADILIATQVPQQIENKKRKILIFKEYQTILENIIKEFETQFMLEDRK